MLEAIARFEELYSRSLDWEYVDEPRRGDHICYITDLTRFRSDHPEWQLQIGLDDLFSRFAATHAKSGVDLPLSDQQCLLAEQRPHGREGKVRANQVPAFGSRLLVV